MLGIAEAENGMRVVEGKLKEEGGGSVSEAGLRDLKIGCHRWCDTSLALSWSGFANCESWHARFMAAVSAHTQSAMCFSAPAFAHCLRSVEARIEGRA